MAKESKNKKNKPVVPESCLLEISGISDFGDFTAVAVNDKDNPQRLKIYVSENRRIKPPLEIGDRFLAHMSLRKNQLVAKPVVRTERAGVPEEYVYGIIEKRGASYFLRPAEKNNYIDYLLDGIGKASEGDFVKVALSGSRRFKEARIVKNFGRFNVGKAAVPLILEKYDIPHEFPPEVLKEAGALAKYNPQGREDLTSVPLVTVDGDDAKDFDDAVYAKETENGFLLIVAIADVAFYVREHTALDREAYKRGNSVYFPDRVIPMLPETLCNGVCSLRPKEKRAAVACFIEIDYDGNILKYDFKRAYIKSAARLTYKEVQNALDGEKSENVAPLYHSVIVPLYEAYKALDAARSRRGALNLETTEVKIKLGKDGMVASVEKEEHYTSHQIIEEFMIAANICAAWALQKSKLPVMYRIHEKPLEEKLQTLEPLLHNLGLKLPDIAALKPEHLNKIIELCSVGGYNQGIGDLILRLQCQARYAPLNVGHFGLGLTDYVHFTSPIRRYADLLIHRALIKAFKMPDGGELGSEMTVKVFEEIGEHLGITERRAVSAERDVVARFLSAYLQPSVGQDFSVKISGLTTAGIFVALENLGAEGLIPMSSLPDDEYLLESGSSALYGAKNGLVFKFGEKLTARLLEASPVTGGLIFKYVDVKEGVGYPEKGGRFRGSFGKMQTLRHKGKKPAERTKRKSEKSKKTRKAKRK